MLTSSAVMLRACAALVLFASPLSFAQSSASSGHTATCSIHQSEPTEAELAFYRSDWKSALQLSTAAYTKDPQDSRNHQLAIDSLIAQGNLTEARKAFDAWSAQGPQNADLVVTAAELRFAEGDWLESYALDLRALKLNPCLPDAYAGLATYEELAGYRVTARKHSTLAHQLAPNDPDIRLQWIGSLPVTEQAGELKAYLESAKALDETHRKSLELRLDRLTNPQASHCQLVSSSGPAIIPMTPIYGRVGVESYGLEIGFNGHKRILQIDTGASGFLLTHSAGASLGLPSAGTSHVGGFGSDGSNDVERLTADTVTVGGLTFHNCAVESLANFGVLGGSHIEGNRMDKGDGLVGSNIFSRYLVTLDYLKHEVRLEPLPALPGVSASAPLDPLGGSDDPAWMQVDRYIAPSMKSWTEIYRRGHQLIVPTRISGTGEAPVKRLFMLDTGAFNNLIDIATAKQITHTQDNPAMFIRGLSGRSGNIFDAGKFTIDFGGLRLPISSMNAMDLSKFGGVSGFLGYPTLEQLVIGIDYRDNLVRLEAPNGKHME